MSCPVCGGEHFPGIAGGKTARSADGRVCPYERSAYMGLRAGHDQLYFGRWRRLDATSIDLRKARRQLERLLRGIAAVLETEDIPAARSDLAKAFEALEASGPDEEGSEVLRYLDHALSYAHRVIGDLLHEKGLPPHSPADFVGWYDAGEVPFREDW